MRARRGDQVVRDIFFCSGGQSDTRLGLPALGRSRKLSKTRSALGWKSLLIFLIFLSGVILFFVILYPLFSLPYFISFFLLIR